MTNDRSRRTFLGDLACGLVTTIVATRCGGGEERPAWLDQPEPAEISAKMVYVALERDYGSELDPVDIALLAELYAPDLARFSELTGIDPSDWARSWGRCASV